MRHVLHTRKLSGLIFAGPNDLVHYMEQIINAWGRLSSEAIASRNEEVKHYVEAEYMSMLQQLYGLSVMDYGLSSTVDLLETWGVQRYTIARDRVQAVTDHRLSSPDANALRQPPRWYESLKPYLTTGLIIGAVVLAGYLVIETLPALKALKALKKRRA